MRLPDKELVEKLRALLAEISDAEFTDAELWKIIKFIRSEAAD